MKGSVTAYFTSKFTKHVVMAFVCLLCMISCNNELSPSSYINWMENPDNGLRKIKTIGVIEYTVQYRTPEYMMLKNNSNCFSDSSRKNGVHYFSLILNPTDKKSQLLHVNLTNEHEYYERMQYYNFYFKNDIYLLVNGKQFPCEFYFFESTGKITPGLTFSLGFDINNEVGDLQMVVNNRPFGSGGLNFLFKRKALNNIPKLKNFS